LVERLRQLPQLRDVTSDLQDRGLQAALFIDRSTASRLGITPDVVDNTLYSAFGQRIVSTIFTQVNQNRVVLEVQPDFQRGPHALNGIYVTGSGTTTTDAAGNVTASGPRQVPLNTIATLTEQVTPLAVTHIGQVIPTRRSKFGGREPVNILFPRCHTHRCTATLSIDEEP
jgi:multidrug efflux pump